VVLDAPRIVSLLTRILIVVRDRRLGLVLKEGFRGDGHRASIVTHPHTASALVDYEAFDLVIVDTALEAIEGFGMLRESCTGSAAPRMMLVDDRLHEDPETLLDRARELLDEPRADDARRLVGGGIELDPWQRRARLGDVEVALTEREYSLLRIFLRHPDRILTREELYLHAWGDMYHLGSNAVDVYVGYLRRKLGAGLIETVRGQGYRLGSGGRSGMLTK
jgi:two-component system, OmpR family, copper resistance phosphate regulon response regulator CusR